MSNIVVLEVLEGSRLKILQLYGRTTETVTYDIEKIKDWLRKQPHIPEIPDDELIERFMVTSKFHIEAVKLKLDAYFSARTLIPELYGQDPTGERAQSVTDALYLVPLPRTAELKRILCFKLRDWSVEKFDIIDILGYLMNIIEVRVREDCCISDIYIYDLQGISMGHVVKITPQLLKKMNYLMENLYKVSVDGIHIINAPTFIESVLSMFSKYFKEKIISRVKTHKTLESLHLAVPKCYLPTEFGGTQQSLAEYQEIWKMKLIQVKPLLDHLKTLKVNELLRPVKLPENDFLGVNGNFRQLDVD
ncbi:hypothetical protein RI129_013065 [Pyrocoelia pectoralis]|uniref:CRAL-TRIO domain-containing protein n=1 Tax=Pyrocoelia pectoralis TaxID=417401 RepID=A0AAN7UVF1_9COLE